MVEEQHIHVGQKHVACYTKPFDVVCQTRSIPWAKRIQILEHLYDIVLFWKCVAA